MPRKSRTVLNPESATFGHAGQVEQHRESGGAFDQCADRGAAESDDQVAFPVSRNRSVRSLGGPLADHDLGAYKLFAAAPAAGPRHAQRPPGAQACRQRAAQGPPPLDVQRLVDGLVRDPHRVIVWILYPEPMGDLLRAPRRRPVSVLAAAMTSPTPGAHGGARHGRPVLSHDRACEAVLHVDPQPIVRGQLGYFRALGTSVAVPLRRRRPIRQTAASSRCVATQLSRDSRRGSTEPTGNVAHPGALRSQERDLFPLREGQVASRPGRQADRRHTTALTEPTTAHGRRHAT